MHPLSGQHYPLLIKILRRHSIFPRLLGAAQCGWCLAACAKIHHGLFLIGPAQLPEAELNCNSCEPKKYDDCRPGSDGPAARHHRGLLHNTGSMRIFIAIVFALIVMSLGSALFYLMRDKGTSNKTVRALALRVGFSVALFLFLIAAHQLGWIESTGLRY
jgi:hypothetical protein